jgi:hypothetical protein
MLLKRPFKWDGVHPPRADVYAKPCSSGTVREAILRLRLWLSPVKQGSPTRATTCSARPGLGNPTGAFVNCPALRAGIEQDCL